MVTEYTVEYILRLADYLKDRFAKQKKLIREMRELRALLHDVQIPDHAKKTTQAVRSPVLPDMVQRITATLSVNPVSWHRPLTGERPTDETDSSLIEHWLPAAHDQMEIQAHRHTSRMLIDAAVADGMAVAEYQWLPHAWSPWPKRKQSEKDEGEYEEEADPYLKRVKKHVREKPFPFLWRDIDALHYHFFDSYNGEREVVLIQEVPLGPTLGGLQVRRGDDGKWRDAKPGEPLDGTDTSNHGETVELIQHITKQSRSYVLDRKKAKQINLNYDRLPVYDFAGLSTSERAPERAFLPVAFAFKELIPLLDRLLTMKANWLYLASYPRGVLKMTEQRLNNMFAQLPKDNQERASAFAANLQNLDSLLLLYENEDFHFVQVPQVGVDLNQMIQIVMGMIDQAGISGVMRGQTPGSEATGYLANQLMTAARLAYDPITDNAKFMFRDGAAFLLYAVDKLAKAAVPVLGRAEDNQERRAFLELASKNIDGIYTVDPRLDPLLPSNLIMEGRFGLEQAQGGAISMYTHRERFMHLESPEEEEKRIAIEAIKNDPRIKAAYYAKVAKAAGLEPPAPPPNPLAGLVGPDGQTPLVNLGNTGMPVTAGMGLPVEPTAVLRPPVTGTPNPNVVPGPGAATGQPGGNFGRRLVVDPGV